MARKPMVTRTIKTTKVNVLCLNIETSEPFNKVVTLPRTYENEKKLFKATQNAIDNETQKAVHIVDQEEVETLYGMTEQDFIDNAHVLDKDTRKMIEEDEDESEEVESVDEFA